jgi:hypothetical protein
MILLVNGRVLMLNGFQTVKYYFCAGNFSVVNGNCAEMKEEPPTEEIKNTPSPPPSDILEWFILPPSPDVKAQNYPPPLRTSTISKFF